MQSRKEWVRQVARCGYIYIYLHTHTHTHIHAKFTRKMWGAPEQGEYLM